VFLLTLLLLYISSLPLLNCSQNMSVILDTLRTALPPQTNPARPLLASFPPAPILPLSPIQYLTAAIDSVAPLIKIRQQKGVMGGGASLPIPVPLGVKQRRRTAMQWILSSAEKRRETRLADRVAREIISVAEGKSSAWERRAAVHKMGVSARSNVRLAMMRRRR
jgi:small subunit ribosomal protein S7